MPRKSTEKAQKGTKERATSEPLYPYTTKPASLRRFLEIVPQKPRPPKVNGDTLKVWGFKDTNDQTIIRVLKVLGLLDSNNDTSQIYADYMRRDAGAAILGRQIRSVYAKLFENVSSPGTAGTEELTSFFNIHSGGSENTIKLQVDTFKALATFATFGVTDPLENPDAPSVGEIGGGTNGVQDSVPAIRIDLHIHLPENKSKSDYDAIMESIANHLYRRTP